MSNENTVEVAINGNSQGAQTAMGQAVVAVSSGATTMKETLNGLTSVFEGLQSKILLVSGILAGGKAFKESIEKVTELNQEAITLQRALGGTAEEANVLNTALGNVFLDSDTYITASRQITKQLNGNSDSFRQMGIATRDAKGELLSIPEIIANSAAALQEYKAGTDRNVMANQLLGRSYDEVLKLAKLTPEVMKDAAQEVQDYHKQLNPEQVLKYRQAMENVGDVLEGIQVVMGTALMPVLTELGEWFSGKGPALVETFRVAIDSLGNTVDDLIGIVSDLHTSINNAFSDESIEKAAKVNTVFTAIQEVVLGAELVIYKFAQTIVLAFTWVYDALNIAAGAIKSIMLMDSSYMVSHWNASLDAMGTALDEWDKKLEAKGKSINERYKAIFDPKKPASTPDPTDKPGEKPKDGKSAIELDKKDHSKDPTRTSEWSAELQGMREAYELQNNLRKFDLSEEVKYWDERLKLTREGTKEYTEVNAKLSSAKLKQAQEAQKQDQALDQVEIARAKAQGDALLNIEEDNARAALDFGQITNAQYLDKLTEFENRRFEIAKQAIIERLQLALSDPNASVAERSKIQGELEELEGNHARKLNVINTQRVAESGQLWADLSDSMASLWDKGIDAMMNGTLRWSNAYKAILAEVGKTFVNFAAQKAKVWLQTEVLQTMYSKAQGSIRNMLEKLGLVQSVSATATAATTKVGANAAVAGSGAASAMASIPYVGPILAIAAMAAMLATVGGLAGSIKSARGGYDIPSGINPVTQLHEQEMVLPKEQANVIRGMADGGDAGKKQPVNNFYINAMDGADVKRVLDRHADVVAGAVTKAYRNGSNVPS
jgi:hypothetical protein